MSDLKINPTNPRANRVHLLAHQPTPENPEPEPGTRGLYRAVCGVKIVAVVQSASAVWPGRPLCKSCREKGNP